MTIKPISESTHPLVELISPESAQALHEAEIALKKANPFFVRVIDNTLVTEAEYQDWLLRRVG